LNHGLGSGLARGVKIFMNQKAKEILGDYTAFYALQRQRLQNLGIEIDGLAISHLAFRTETLAEYLVARQKLEALCAANKRVKNILAKQDNISSDKPSVILDLLHNDAEITLAQQMQKLSKKLSGLVEKGLYTEALTELSSLRLAVDTFFDEVMVMDDDAALRKNRLNLLAKLHGLFLNIADISVLEI